MFSPYLDGQVSGVEMHALSRTEECPRCTREYSALQRNATTVGDFWAEESPADLALKLRVAASQQAARIRRPRFQGLLVRVENRSTPS